MARTYVHEARRRVGPKRARIHPVIERLKAAHPDAAIALRSRSPLELLVAVMLSAQTTDVNVNRVTDRLFEKYRRRAEDGERRRRGAWGAAGNRRRHACASAVSAARLHARGGSGEDRARPRA